MMFESAGPSIVKSIKQRDLLNSWIRILGRNGTIPRFGDYRPTRLDDELSDMMAFEVIGHGDDAQFLTIHEGARLAAAYGVDPAGRISGTTWFLHEAIGPERYQIILPNYRTCIAHQRPVYSVSTVTDKDGVEVAYERLLLPFGSGAHVDHIVGSYKAISLAGGFKITDILSLGAAPPIHSIRAIIDLDLAAPSRMRGSTFGSDVIET